MFFSEWCKSLQGRENGEHIFRTHMLNSERISKDDFVSHCSPEGILDYGETFDDYLSYSEGVDFFRVNLPESPSYILSHAGHEAFFTPGGQRLSYFDLPGNALMEEQLWGAGLARVIAPANSAAALNNGLEEDRGMITQCVQHLAGTHDRYLLHLKGRVVAGILVKDDVVDTLYTCRGERGEGYASALFRVAKGLHPDLRHSDSLTDAGKGFKRKLEVSLEF